MERKTTVVSFASLLLAALFLSAIGAAAQHSQHHPQQVTPKGESEADSMTAGRMMSHGMMAHHQEMEKVIDRLLENFAALGSEENRSALKGRLAEHGALLEQLQSKFNQRSEMMKKMMDHMKSCPMMSEEHKQD